MAARPLCVARHHAETHEVHHAVAVAVVADNGGEVGGCQVVVRCQRAFEDTLDVGRSRRGPVWIGCCRSDRTWSVRRAAHAVVRMEVAARFITVQTGVAVCGEKPASACCCSVAASLGNPSGGPSHMRRGEWWIGRKAAAMPTGQAGHRLHFPLSYELAECGSVQFPLALYCLLRDGHDGRFTHRKRLADRCFYGFRSQRFRSTIQASPSTQVMPRALAIVIHWLRSLSGAPAGRGAPPRTAAHELGR